MAPSPPRSYTRQDVRDGVRVVKGVRAGVGASLIVVDGGVYDVGGFAHPGGERSLRAFVGGARDASSAFRGDGGRSSVRAHAHSDAARRILARLKVGVLVEDDDVDDDDDDDDAATASEDSDDAAASEDGSTTTTTIDAHGVDLSKPLVAQVGALGDAYESWTREPLLGSGPMRFFKSDVLERASRTRWWVVPTVWLPVAFAAFARGVLGVVAATERGRVGGDDSSDSIAAIAGAGDRDDSDAVAARVVVVVVVVVVVATFFAIGAAAWSVGEYVFHRFVFHRAPRTRAGIVAHFLMHGCHHKSPMDALRLVFPPAPWAAVVAASWLAWCVPYTGPHTTAFAW